MTDNPSTPGGSREDSAEGLDDRIAAALRSRFEPDVRSIERALAEPATPAEAQGSGSWSRWLAAAAAIVVIAWTAWRFSPFGNSGPEVNELIQVTSAGGHLLDLWADAYEKAELEGFRAPSCCAPGSDIAALCR